LERMTLEHCQTLDGADPLAPLREEFELDTVVYLDGNSLGRLPRAARRRIREVVDSEWGRDLIGGWNAHEWIDLPRRVGDLIGGLIGAGAGQIVAGDSTSVNLFKLIAAVLGSGKRRRIVTDSANFPTDLYMLEGLARLVEGVQIVRARAPDVAAAIDSRTAIVALTHVDYRSGAMYDMRALTARAHQCGALALWDLSHSAGVLPLSLDADEVDLAVGCTYKYLNGGPGSPGYAYVARRLHDSLQPVLSGWMGHRAPFAFAPGYEPAAGVRRFACGTPEVLALSVVESALAVFERTDLDAIRDKSLRLTQLFIELADTHLAGLGFEIVTPRQGALRGSHVSIAHEHGYPIMQALIARGIVGDFRAPNLLRFGFSPLYQRYNDVWVAVEAMRAIVRDREWDQERFHRRAFVT